MLAVLSVPLFDPAAVPSPRPCTLAFAAARRRRQGRPSRKPRHNVRLREAAPWTVASTAAGLHGSGRRRSDDRAPRSWSPQCSLRQANYVHTDASFPVPVPDFSTACGNGNGNANASRPAPAAFLGSAPAELPSSRPLQTNAGARSGGQDRPPLLGRHTLRRRQAASRRPRARQHARSARGEAGPSQHRPSNDVTAAPSNSAIGLNGQPRSRYGGMERPRNLGLRVKIWSNRSKQFIDQPPARASRETAIMSCVGNAILRPKTDERRKRKALSVAPQPRERQPDVRREAARLA